MSRHVVCDLAQFVLLLKHLVFGTFRIHLSTHQAVVKERIVFKKLRSFYWRLVQLHQISPCNKVVANQVSFQIAYLAEPLRNRLRPIRDRDVVSGWSDRSGTVLVNLVQSERLL